MINSFSTRLILHIFLFSSLAEYLLLRFLSRLGPVFPEGRFFNLLFTVLFQAGALALNFAAITGLLFMFVWMIKTFQEKQGAFYPLPVLAAFLTALVGFVYPFIHTNISAPILTLLLTGVSWFTMLLALAIWTRERKQLTLALLVFFSYTLAYFHFWVKQDFLSTPLFQAKYLLAISELLALLVPLLTFIIYKPRGNILTTVLAGIFSSFVFLLYLFKPGVAAALAMWNQSFTGYLPFVIYPLAVGLYIFNIMALYKSPGYKAIAIGLTLIALGGLRLEYNYFNLVALTGFLLLARSAYDYRD